MAAVPVGEQLPVAGPLLTATDTTRTAVAELEEYLAEEDPAGDGVSPTQWPWRLARPQPLPLPDPPWPIGPPHAPLRRLGGWWMLT